ncbi:hypothetical protein SmJEL517_g02024 [Synchytrium microbalum]|uniref:Rap-GAP domain-containing protein n=1 Tax=Synchytrium microbalum TaxID=1806994 RepID=A0A507C8Q8_9FUNG|nr:uncharacterized protein SmJEL517_g02024 [Synchytrium microbalum]TPX35718.1 hypothetical protein SmJEL517_g02024 [Synchytrium microbalum]
MEVVAEHAVLPTEIVQKILEYIEYDGIMDVKTLARAALVSKDLNALRIVYENLPPPKETGRLFKRKQLDAILANIHRFGQDALKHTKKLVILSVDTGANAIKYESSPYRQHMEKKATFDDKSMSVSTSGPPASTAHHEGGLRSILDRFNASAPSSGDSSALHDLCIYIQSTASLLPSEVTHIWSLLQPLVGQVTILDFINVLLEEQYDVVGNVAGMRSALFTAVTSLSSKEATPTNGQIKSLDALSRHGTDLTEFELDMVPILADWLSSCDDVTDESVVTFILTLAAETVKANIISPGNADKLVISACNLCTKPMSDVTASALSLLEVIAQQKALSNTVLPRLIETLCNTVNWERHLSKSWNILKSLLESPRGRRCMVLLCTMLEEVDKWSHITVRGAVFSIAMSTWGTQRVKDAFYSRSFYLSYFIRVVTSRSNDLVDVEILKSISRLVKKYGILSAKPDIVVRSDAKNHGTSKLDEPSVSSKSAADDVKGQDLTVFEWEAIIAILISLTRCWNDASGLQASLPQPVNRWRVGETLDSPAGATNMSERLGALHTLLTFYQTVLNGVVDVYLKLEGASSTLYYDLLYQLAPHLSLPLASMLLDHIIISLWQVDLDDQIKVLSNISNTFYMHESRPLIRKKFVAMLSNVFSSIHPAERDELYDRVFVPLIVSFGKESDRDVFTAIVDLILNMVVDIDDDQATNLVSVLLESAVTNSLSPQGDTTKTDSIKVDSETDKPLHSLSLEALMDLFEIGLLNASPVISVSAFSAIVKVAGMSSIETVSRLTALRFLMKIRADSRYHVRFPSSIPATKSVDTVVKKDDATSNVGAKKDDAQQSTKKDDVPMDPMPELEEARKWWTRRDTITSPQVVCYEELIASIVNNNPRPTSTSPLPVNIDAVKALPIDLYAATILEVLMSEKSWEIYSLVLNQLPAQMENIYFWAGAYKTLPDIRKQLCRAILDEKVAASVLDMPQTTRKADLYSALYRLLLSLIPHRRLLTVREVQDEVVMAFHAGLNRGPTNARLCLQALTLCLYELPSSMTRLLPETKLGPGILDRLSRMPSQALILEFLSSLARLSDLYVNFTERDFKRVFGMAVQYISTGGGVSNSAGSGNIMTQYLFNMAYHVVTVWFTAMKVSERRRYVPFIVHYFMLPLQQQQQQIEKNEKSEKKPLVLDENVEMILDMMIQNTFADCTPKPPESKTDSKNISGAGLSKTWIVGNALLTIRTSMGGWSDVTIRRASGWVSFSVRLDNRFRFEESSNLTRRGSLNVREVSDPVAEEDNPSMSDSFTSQGNIPKAQHKRWGSVELSAGAGIGSKNLNRQRSVHGRSSATSALPSTLPVESEVESGRSTPRSRGSSISSQTTDPAIAADTAVSRLSRALTSNTGSQSNLMSNNTTLDPVFLLAQIMPYPDMVPHEVPRLLADDDMTARFISVLDLTPVVDLHKLGVLYVGPGQKKEAEILSNTQGSRAYGLLLRSLGSMIRLKGIRDVNTGGLDTRDDIDGTHAVYWQDDCAQVIFHAATLMPTVSYDERCTAKKRHLGNDSIILVWNESGAEYEFDTLPGQFNHINLVITPLDADYPLSVVGGVLEDEAERASGIPIVATLPSTYRNSYYRVSMQRRPDIPDIGPLSEPRLVSGACLARFVRQIAIHANIAVQIFLGGAGGGNVKERLRMIRRIRQRYITSTASSSAIGGSDSGSVGQQQVTTPPGPSTQQDSGSSSKIDSEAMLTFTRYI